MIAPHILDNWKEDWESRICAGDGCYNAPARGYTHCPNCLWGPTYRADDAAVRAKKRAEKKAAKETSDAR